MFYVVYKNGCSKKLLNIHMKAPVLESVFDKVTG